MEFLAVSWKDLFLFDVVENVLYTFCRSFVYCCPNLSTLYTCYNTVVDCIDMPEKERPSMIYRPFANKYGSLFSNWSSAKDSTNSTFSCFCFFSLTVS